MDISELNKIIRRYSNIEDLLMHINQYYGKLIKVEKSQKAKNKYIKIRNSMLSYIVANKQHIMAELRNKR